MPAVSEQVPWYQQPVTKLSGVGPAVAEKLQRIGIKHIIDLLFHVPFRYQDRTTLYPLGGLQIGQQVMVEGVIEVSDVVFRGRRALICHISDGTGVLALRFFYFSNAQKAQLKRGQRIRCFGEVRHGAKVREMIHPEYQLVKAGELIDEQDYYTPMYPVTEGLQQARMRTLVSRALNLTKDESLPDWIPAEVLTSLKFPDIDTAVRTIHQPPSTLDLVQLNEGQHPVQRRLALDELLAHQMSLKLLRQRMQRDPGIALKKRSDLVQKFIATLPFTLTSAQARVINEVLDDVQHARPMLRLLQGDVGSGKTVVAAAIALRAIENQTQVAYMAPTELLAEQHFRSFCTWLEPLNISVVGLVSKMPSKKKRETLAKIAAGDADIIVGTHALFQEQVEYHGLALAIVDEQHRFGVQQRLQLKAKGKDGVYPHQLVMTATPIPRTLAMSAYADLDYSVLDTLPPGRKPITTVVMSDQKRSDVTARIFRACEHGQQAYWVCPLVNESEVLECQAAEVTALALQEALPQIRVGLIHGQLKSNDKELAMAKFSSGEIDLLVATTVIEVGVDVPNASLMVIENAERLGLAQLHQLRGRIGRGDQQSVCVLLYKPPLKGNARKRLEVIRSTTDGFEIAEQDLRLRGPGEVLGTRQTGRLQMKIADVVRDADLLPVVHRASALIFDSFPDHIHPLVNRWVAEEGRYGGV